MRRAAVLFGKKHIAVHEGCESWLVRTCCQDVEVCLPTSQAPRGTCNGRCVEEPPGLLRVLASAVEHTFATESEQVRRALVQEHREGCARWVAEGGQVCLVAAGGLASVSLIERARPRAWVLAIAHESVVRDSGAIEQPVPSAEGVARWLAAHAHEHAETRRVVVGGPPEGYLFCGLDPGEALALALAAAGFRPIAAHVDLVARPARAAPDPRVRRAQAAEREALSAWVGVHFSRAWAAEVSRALEGQGAVFVTGTPGGYLGFSAHSGHNAAAGTFGPLGVLPLARGQGLGIALARAALSDLAARGFACVTIPWVATEMVAFYRPLVANLEVRSRVMLAAEVVGTLAGCAAAESEER